MTRKMKLLKILKLMTVTIATLFVGSSFALGPTKTPDYNPGNRLDKLVEFSGKNYGVAVAGSDLVNDIGGDQQADELMLPRQVSVEIPDGATVEAAYVSYYGSAFLTTGGGVDNTPDTVSGAELGIDNLEDIANNEINITVDGQDLGALTPATVGGDSRSKPSWWNMYAKAGTLAESRIVMYNNRLDVTEFFTGKTGVIPVEVTRLQRADFTGATKSAMSYMYQFYGPSGTNDNGDYANDCLANASFSVVVVYSLPEGANKTISIYDGMSWAWNNDFATNRDKAYNPITYKLGLDIDVEHAAVSADGDLNVYMVALDGDELGHTGVSQCGASMYPHDTGIDHTWVKSGSAQESYFANIYEGINAPAEGTAFADYANVTTVANGLNFNVIKIGVQNVEDGATNTLIHVEGDSPTSTDGPQEAMLVAFAIVEGTQYGEAVEEGTVEEGTVEEGTV
ncbi:MAG: hypothetical protein D6B27_01365, partial [Gammaproteobacteria bacterium]